MRTLFPYHIEDRVKAEFFTGSPPGFFVEVEANDPQCGFQTWQLEQAGCSGVLIEPQADLAVRRRQRRRARVFEVACSSPANAGRSLRLYLLGPHSSLEPELVVTGVVPCDAIDVTARMLDEILQDADAPVPVDFASIDVEGHVVEVLRGFDLARWRPRLFLVEDHVTTLATHRFLSCAGYRLIRRTGLNGWYVPRTAAPPLGFGRLQIVRKYYLALPIRKLRDRKRRWRDRLRGLHKY